MNDLEINNLLNELHINNLLLKKIVAINEAYNDLDQFIKGYRTIKIRIGSKVDFDITLNQVSKYSLYLIDKIIDITDESGKHIYNRKDLANI